MAGESISFKAESLHSGSISFGRFEGESLAWERRSSFSHNRYLEEVEKCSKAGSVTQKKAYFEAHFKKKGLLLQTSSVSQNGMEHQTNENDILDHMSYMEELEQGNEGSHFANYDEISHNSDQHGKYDIMGCEMEVEDFSPKFDMEPPLTNSHAVLDDDDQLIELDITQQNQSLSNADELLDGDQQQHAGTHQSEYELTVLPLVKDEPEMEVKHNIADETENMDGKNTKLSTSSCMAGKADTSRVKKPRRTSPKVKAVTETKSARPKPKTQIPRKISNELYKDPAKSPRRIEREAPVKTKTEKRSPQKVSPAIGSQTRITKRETGVPSQYPGNLKVKSSQENKSEKDTRMKKAGSKSQPYASEKDESKAHQTANRSKKTVISPKTYVKSSPAVFNFKCDERAEKRKELEEKMLAKEVEMNQIQARTQEETEAEIKQFRRSLNFKATPMPSFYHETPPLSSNAKKGVSNDVKSTKQRGESTSPASRAASRSQASSEAGNQNLSASESANITVDQQVSEEINCAITVPTETDGGSPNLSTNRSHAPQTGKRIEAAGKKEKEKSKHPNIQKQLGSETSKVKKERVERKRVDGKVGQSSNEVASKETKGVDMGIDIGGSGLNNLAVGVAS
ncbi:PREDICTED: protein WVD2-like 7 isoform X2 [Nelumbo nucifera]|uniref:Protein WVD2-like 7 isoform X2 n=2 Tax=Nelumbo nucifera TaxID=4432 RepID=A0A1U8AD70_NELNU|nr:PREDICTED: protein WVD2-like 7 isoform X2 [Nelumbo nucifera]DAD35660.1 TPA_asm: hypothetical protein HUJ06_006300 [Nelumbo nucifera]